MGNCVEPLLNLTDYDTWLNIIILLIKFKDDELIGPFERSVNISIYIVFQTKTYD